jgi:cytochrome d ubiquinol oxidase subunit I
MIGLALYGLYLIRKKKLMKFAWYHKIALWALALPFIANATGWVMTEMGRQPFVVYGLLKTDDAASVAVSSGEVLTTLIGFTLLYGVLAFVDFYLMAKYAKAGPDPDMDEAQIAASMAY